VRKEKLGGRIAALHQLVSPFGKVKIDSINKSNLLMSSNIPLSNQLLTLIVEIFLVSFLLI